VKGKLYGPDGGFTDHEQVVTAAKQASDGAISLDAYTPFPVEDLPEALGHRRNWNSIFGADRRHRWSAAAISWR